MTHVYDAANWSKHEDDFTQMFYNQNVKQFWLPEEVALNGDLLTWKYLTPAEKDTYMKVLAGLTLLDTEQGNTGMPLVAEHVQGHQRKAVLNFMAMMENAVHAKSYSNIFMTLATSEEINDLFEWVKVNPRLQKKANTIVSIYKDIKRGDDISLFKALVASVYLESFLFYSGFYYPLYFYGQGKLMQSGEIINLILRDEAIHGVYIGLLAQEIYNKQSPDTQKELHQFAIELLDELYKNELLYTEDLYDQVGLSHDVKKFIRYNANKALMNLGFDPYFEDEEINPIVLNGLNTKTKSHDFFSMKGNGYKKATVEPLRDEDFFFPEAEEKAKQEQR
ncbi:class 1b ribonucleoside-diphosphate reductase subunit beta [Shouchella clausii]|jgi:ribonucleoside-diphosphate reductase beta chain|uniref:Ribonucleoside-diphosphate reductase subunit beta n=1 Tax=Shouchella clausii TaxID=79880 RepID=A0A268RXJ1_SHOCL|nr:class 1b ribonucleoside-diphosphate reductase subunit beta [Shouchella clausii]PAD43144.1 class 1b ribonucleoside-diphosphate reductase subunit beta [Bacillus sp. 7520-S]SPT80963.1 ribonucleotide-diphosphate reductase subunit beta [Niallia circulans]AST96685.1 class 1b ribonucleoside-diphosphate reductase subunit beta [Shouchella clausii]MBU8596687.1 class 1b ribonucleoside-diphosphate reductase subunit beta [Shouchella clausii]MCM3550320.1 class 1b ribonucleoside-diphosphate reductase subu